MTQRDVAAAMDWSQSKLIRIESGAVSISTNDLRALLHHYRMDSGHIDALVDVARAAREPTPWGIYRDVVTPEYLAFLGYESSASIIRNFEPQVVPGLLQTEEYAQEILSFFYVDNPQKIDPLVNLRMQRQELLVREPAPNLHFIMDEAVIRRVVGGRDVMRRQLRHVQQLAEYQNITIRIVPFEQGMYQRLQVAYQLFQFPNPEDEYVLYVENPHGEYIVREGFPEAQDRESPVHYLEVFYSLEQIASIEETQNLLRDAITRLTNEPSPPSVGGTAAAHT